MVASNKVIFDLTRAINDEDLDRISHIVLNNSPENFIFNPKLQSLLMIATLNRKYASLNKLLSLGIEDYPCKVAEFSTEITTALGVSIIKGNWEAFFIHKKWYEKKHGEFHSLTVIEDDRVNGKTLLSCLLKKNPDVWPNEFNPWEHIHEGSYDTAVLTQLLFSCARFEHKHREKHLEKLLSLPIWSNACLGADEMNLILYHLYRGEHFEDHSKKFILKLNKLGVTFYDNEMDEHSTYAFIEKVLLNSHIQASDKNKSIKRI